MSSLQRKTVSGVLWSGMSKIVMQLVLILVTAILAHKLSRAAFGIVGMAAIITVAIGMVNDKGLGMSIVQKKDMQASHLSTMFWGSVAFGLLLYAVSFVISYPLALFFREAIVQPVIAVIALGFIIGSFGIVQKSLLTRDMDFKKLAIVELSATLLAGTGAVGAANLGLGVWSLVINVLARDFITVVLLWIVCDWRPSLHFSGSEFKEYLGFSSNVLANDGAIYLITNTDMTIIGRVLGTAPLGVYNMALYLVKLPVTRLSAIVAKVVFPAFSSLQDDVEKFKAGFLKAIKYISLLTFPMLALLAVFSREFILVVLGEKWIDAAWPLIILTPMAMLKSIGTIKSSVLMAVGRPDIELKWNLVYLVPLAGVVYYGTQFGLIGVATAFTALYIITFPIIQQITNKQISVTFPEFLISLRTAFFSTLFLILAGFSMRYVLKTILMLPNILVLVVGLLVAGLTYLLVIFLIDKKVLTEFRSIFLKKQATPSQTLKTTMVVSE
jgi:PST family polysaccharide transporter